MKTETDLPRKERFTPTPWLCQKRNAGRTVTFKREHWEVCGGDELKGVAVVFRTEANAKLIAAAPDLFHACKLAEEQLVNSIPIGEPNDALHAIRAAIQKALPCHAAQT